MRARVRASLRRAAAGNAAPRRAVIGERCLASRAGDLGRGSSTASSNGNSSSNGSSGSSGNSSSNSQSDRPGQHKSPITDYLWNLRESVKAAQRAERIKVAEREESLLVDTQLDPQPPRRHEVEYAFSTDASLRDQYLNPFGTIRLGRVLEDLDALAGNISYDHCSRDNPAIDNMSLVTASIDRIVLGHRANLRDDITLSGQVTWVGSSSMEITMSACSSWTNEPWLHALFTFVARDKTTGKALRVNPLTPQTEEDHARFRDGQRRAEERKALRKSPAGAALVREHVEQIVNVEAHDRSDVTIEEAAAALFADSRRRLLVPAIGLRDSIRISETSLSSTSLMQPQMRNTGGKIFGGFLVRRAFELAFATAYLFSGVAPRFREVDSVDFRRPVDVGDLVQFKSCVLFTSSELHPGPSVHVEVEASVITPEARESNLSNRFNFSFEVPPGSSLARVVPETHEQALTIVQRYYSDIAQKAEDDAAAASSGALRPPVLPA